jgi:hypothetical protein
MRALIAVAVALGLAGCAPLSTETRIEETGYQVLAAVDMSQTLRVADTPHYRQRHEDNPLLGEHPSPVKVAAYFGACGASHYAVTWALTRLGAPPWALRAWEASGIALEAASVSNNAGDGVRPTLSFHVSQ